MESLIAPVSEGYSELQVLESAAGFYVGTIFNMDGITVPGSRDSDYFPSHEKAAKHLQGMKDSLLREWPNKETLPSPNDLLAHLQQGKPCLVNGHRLTPDEHGVWVTNPYGVDSGLWQELSLQRVKIFLDDMEQDAEYGPVP